MGYKEFDIKIPVYADEKELKNSIKRITGIKDFSYSILKKSLDARQKNKIVWQYRVGLVSDEIKSGVKPEIPTLHPTKNGKCKHVVIVGSGPAGIFSALYLTQSGYKVTLIERGGKVEQRKEAIDQFEKGGSFDSINNYSFGEGGAGTFSDGKLTSRTKSITLERNYIYQQFIAAGAPDEIFYMTHPHIGSDNLFKIAQNLRSKLEILGCTILFETALEDLTVKDNRVISVRTSAGEIDADYFILAIGHSAFETYRMLMQRGVKFHAKNFALGFRAEHQQEIINVAQWGIPVIQGIKAAEYRLTSQTNDNTAVYSFCMCPGGKVVPAAAYAKTNIVNGMSNYQRDNRWANAAVVAAMHPERIFKRTVSASETLDWLENLENRFFEYSKGYKAPSARISDFMNNKTGSTLPASSYPLGLIPADFHELLPSEIIPALQEGLRDFSRKLRGYESGIILGLESKTSAPIQVERDLENLNARYENLYIAGEGSGWAGGIISSAADGLKVAQRVAAK